MAAAASKVAANANTIADFPHRERSPRKGRVVSSSKKRMGNKVMANEAVSQSQEREGENCRCVALQKMTKTGLPRRSFEWEKLLLLLQY